MTADDNELMLIIQEGDLAKLGVLYERYHQKLYAYFYRVCGDASLSEDMVQNVFERILKYCKSFNGENQFAHWLFRIARNTWLDHYRKGKNELHNVSTDSLAIADDSDNAQKRLEKKEKKDLMKAALNALSPEKREAIVLSRFEGLKYKEIAAIAETTETNIKTRVRRGLIDLKGILLQLQSQQI